MIEELINLISPKNKLREASLGHLQKFNNKRISLRTFDGVSHEGILLILGQYFSNDCTGMIYTAEEGTRGSEKVDDAYQFVPLFQPRNDSVCVYELPEVPKTMGAFRISKHKDFYLPNGKLESYAMTHFNADKNPESFNRYAGLLQQHGFWGYGVESEEVEDSFDHEYLCV